MPCQAVPYEKKGRIATVTLDQPESLNALSTQLVSDMVGRQGLELSDCELHPKGSAF